MHRLKAGLIGLLCLVGVAGCTTNNSIAPVNFTTNAVMQLSVGGLNDTAGVLSLRVTGTSSPGIYLNAVSTFRNQFGNSAFLAPGTAMLTTPSSGTFTIGTLFQYGKSPTQNTVEGFAPAYSPPNTEAGVGGGYSTGWLIQTNSPTCPLTAKCLLGVGFFGGYTLATTVAINSTLQTFSASATLPLTTPILGTPTTSFAYAPTGITGGGTVTLSATPALITERLVVITGTTASHAEVATALISGAATTVVLPAGTLISGHAYDVFVLGADYPLFEDGPPNALTQSPALTTNATSTSNMSVSAQFAFTG
jgi:hypothetical protein